GLHHPLKEQTIQDIREGFKLISARERELAEEAGLTTKDRPRYALPPMP
ncbi:MAG: segregation and condensation protein A, partial [Gammaproteobacteria bacterium]|nr:segregation and condensation protein A [Gammaproteobacteria bacterium]